jgi:hypothetical protein
MKPRITINMASDGELKIFVNELGRDLLVRELQGLNERSDHFYLGAFEGAEVEMQDKAYRPSDTVVGAAKVLFRPDDWDRRYYPHVLS